MFFQELRPLIIFAVLIISLDTLACSCARVGILKNKNQAEFVFKGRVREIHETNVREIDPRTKDQVDYRQTRYTFKIIRIYKGLKDKEAIDLLTGITDCEVTFSKGKTYIVYAYTDNKKLHYRLADQQVDSYMTTHLCTRTKKTSALTFWESFVLWLT